MVNLSEKRETECMDQDSSTGMMSNSLTESQFSMNMYTHTKQPRNVNNSSQAKNKGELHKQYRHRKPPPPPLVEHAYQPPFFPHRAHSCEHILMHTEAQEHVTKENPMLIIASPALPEQEMSNAATHYEPLHSFESSSYFALKEQHSD